jgi:hypothetical protein
MADYGVPPNPPYVDHVVIEVVVVIVVVVVVVVIVVDESINQAKVYCMLMWAMPASKNSSPSIVKPWRW